MNEFNDLTYAESRLLLFLLNYNAENPVKKTVITSHLNISARAFRNLCLDLRNKGYTICFKLDGGYYIADSKDEYLKFRDQYTSYYRSIRQAVTAMDTRMILKEDIQHLLSEKAVNTNETA